jgi:hypothetical protein
MKRNRPTETPPTPCPDWVCFGLGSGRNGRTTAATGFVAVLRWFTQSHPLWCPLSRALCRSPGEPPTNFLFQPKQTKHRNKFRRRKRFRVSVPHPQPKHRNTPRAMPPTTSAPALRAIEATAAAALRALWRSALKLDLLHTKLRRKP